MAGLAKGRVNIVIASLIMRFINFHVSACKLNVAFSVSFSVLEHKSFVITECCRLQGVIKMDFMISEAPPPAPSPTSYTHHHHHHQSSSGEVTPTEPHKKFRIFFSMFFLFGSWINSKTALPLLLFLLPFLSEVQL